MNSIPYVTYTEEFKKNAVQKLLLPGSSGLKPTATLLGIPSSTLYGWKRKYATASSMKTKTSKDWTAEEKLDAVICTSSMNEQETGEYLRSHGLHSSDLERFREECLAALKGKGRPKLDPALEKLRKEYHLLEKNLKRKDRALAEMSARIILLKKSHEIWGVPEDDE